MNLLKRNNLFPPLFSIINNINGYLNILYGLELLISSPGSETRNCDIWRKLANTKKTANSDLLKMCLKYFCQNKANHVKTDVPKSTFTDPYNMMTC